MPVHRLSFRRTLPFGIAASLWGLAGCAGENARIVAQQTLQTTTRYEQQVDRKIAAERTFYATQASILSDALAGGPAVPDQAGAAGLSTQTWLYGRIRVTADQDARETAGRILTSHDGEVLALVSAFVARGMEVNREALAEVSRSRTAMAQQLAGTLVPLEKQRARLKTLRDGLKTLSTEPDDDARLIQLQDIAKVLVTEFRRIATTSSTP